jgi:hypothetical protein
MADAGRRAFRFLDDIYAFSKQARGSMESMLSKFNPGTSQAPYHSNYDPLATSLSFSKD